MNAFFILCFTAITAISFAQNRNKELHEISQQINQQKSSIDTLNRKINNQIIEQGRRIDSVAMINYQEQNNRNLNNLVAEIKKADTKARRTMWFRMIFGISILAIGIFALLRRRQKPTA